MQRSKTGQKMPNQLYATCYYFFLPHNVMFLATKVNYGRLIIIFFQDICSSYNIACEDLNWTILNVMTSGSVTKNLVWFVFYSLYYLKSFYCEAEQRNLESVLQLITSQYSNNILVNVI